MPEHLIIQAYSDARRLPGGDLLPVIRLGNEATWSRVLGESAAAVVILENCRSGADLQHAHMALSVAEARLGIAEATTRIIASAADTAESVLGLASYAGKSPRLVGLTWDRAAFCADIGCGLISETAEAARLQLVIAARAAGVVAYDSPKAKIGGDGLSEAFIEHSRSLGFHGAVLLTQGRCGRISSNTSLASE